jgi:hypothetical protein
MEVAHLKKSGYDCFDTRYIEKANACRLNMAVARTTPKHPVDLANCPFKVPEETPSLWPELEDHLCREGTNYRGQWCPQGAMGVTRPAFACDALGNKLIIATTCD